MVYEFLSIADATRANTLAKLLGPRGATSILDFDRIIVQENVPTGAFDSEFEQALRFEGIALIKAACI